MVLLFRMKTSVFRMLNSSEGYEKSIFSPPFVLFSDIINFSTSLVRCSLCFPVFLIFSHAITDGMKTHISLQEFKFQGHYCNSERSNNFFVSFKYVSYCSFIGEESVAAGEGSILTDNPTWIIDPIDGTTNFVHRSTFHFLC